jgi:hypothetical protein
VCVSSLSALLARALKVLAVAKRHEALAAWPLAAARYSEGAQLLDNLSASGSLLDAQGCAIAAAQARCRDSNFCFSFGTNIKRVACASKRIRKRRTGVLRRSCL